MLIKFDSKNCKSLTEVLLPNETEMFRFDSDEKAKLDKKRNCIHDFFVSGGRVKHAILIPSCAMSCAIDTIIGLGSSMVDICTFGKINKISKYTKVHISKSSLLFSKPFQQILLIFNPKNDKALFKEDNEVGLFTSFVYSGSFLLQGRCRHSNWFNRQVSTRLILTLSIIASLIARIVDIIIGFIAAFCALVTIGHFKLMNSVAFQGLQIPGIIFDIWINVHLFLNPFSLVEKETDHYNKISQEHKTRSRSIVTADEQKNVICTLQRDFNQIKTVYESFLVNNDISRLNECISLIENLEKTYKALYSIDKQGASKIKDYLTKAQSYVQEMNRESNMLTRQDVRGIATFFNKPIEEDYIDEDGVVYIQPDHSNLLKFGGSFFVKCDYTSIGMLRNIKLNKNLCDILYLEKNKDQISFESRNKSYVNNLRISVFKGLPEPRFQEESSFFSFLRRQYRSNERIIKTIKTQCQMIIASIRYLDEKTKEWQYRDYKICDEKELFKLGLDETTCCSNHAMMFFYEKK